MKNYTINPVAHAFLAQAVADAVGRTFEFGNASPKEVQELIDSDCPLRITDDTQMMLFGAEALIKSKLHSIDVVKIDLDISYKHWYYTQVWSPEQIAQIAPDSVLANSPLMQEQQAPGVSCMKSLQHLALTGQYMQNDSMGCGAVMRLLPFHYLPNDLWKREIVRHSVRITHGHAEAQLAAQKLMWAYGDPANSELTAPARAITDLGEGWTAPEAVDMAVWAYNDSTTYEELLVTSICHPGDSDSVAAIAGSLWGVAGLPIPHRLASRLVQVDLVVEMADQLHALVQSIA
jgi:ADP-ribosylglycohydrolase